MSIWSCYQFINGDHFAFCSCSKKKENKARKNCSDEIVQQSNKTFFFRLEFIHESSLLVTLCTKRKKTRA